MMYLKEMLLAGAIMMGLSACSKDNDTITWQPEERERFLLYHEPTKGWVGDVMPYYINGRFEIFYLNDATDVEKQSSTGQHPIFKLSTDNLVDVTDDGEVIPYGTANTQDHLIGTGSMIQVGDTYYFYYTGHNGSASWLQNNNTGWVSPNNREAVMYATSSDMVNWTKQTDFILKAPSGYARNDFRDPYVFYNEEFGEYWMLVSTQQNGRGVLLLYTSDNPGNNDWKLDGPLTIPDHDYLMLECADIFKVGDKYYLLFGEDWTGTPGTHYRVATSTRGPWLKPESGRDMLDGHQFYAGKTASDGSNRYAFAWAHRRNPENDNGARTWAGNLITHEIYALSNGELAVRIPEAFSSKINTASEWSVVNKEGTVNESNNGLVLADAASATLNELGGTNRITATLSLGSAESLSLFFGTGESTGSTYEIRFEKNNNRIAGYNLGNEVTRVPFDFSGDDSYDITLVVDGSIVVVYVNDQVALTNRSYGLQHKNWRLTAHGGQVSLTNFSTFKAE